MSGAVRATTRLAGVLGWPVEHSLSPAMHNAAFRALGLDFVYVPLAVRPDDLAQAVAGLRALRFVGANVTIPHKVAIIGLLDGVSREAELVGAVNTVVRTGAGRLEGHNTDGAGFLAALREEADLAPDGLRVVLLGAGGAGRAVAVSLALGGALTVTLANRTPGRADALCRELTDRLRRATFEAVGWAGDDLRSSLREADLLVNCTAVGMRSDSFSPPVPLEALPGHAVVADLVYGAQPTQLVRDARARGLRAFDGLGMLVHQGALAQQMWTGARAPVRLLAEAAQEALAGT